GQLGLDTGLMREPTDGTVGFSSERISEPVQNLVHVCVCVLEVDQESRSRDKAGSGTLNAATNLSQHADYRPIPAVRCPCSGRG
ncbi:Uncharacterized protein DAT39_017177, partial [Clarias magur]